MANKCTDVAPYLEKIIQNSPELEVLQIANCHVLKKSVFFDNKKAYESLKKIIIQISKKCEKLKELTLDIKKYPKADYLVKDLCSGSLRLNLTNLSLGDGYTFQDNQLLVLGLLKMLSEKFPNLKVLKIPNYYFDYSIEYEGLKKLKQLEELHIGSLTSYVDKPCCPNLKILSINDFFQSDFNYIQKIIQVFPQLRSLKICHPLEYFYFDPKYFDEKIELIL